MASPTADNSEPPFLTPAQVAQRLRVSPVTVRHWALNGKLSFVTTPGGHRRFLLEEVERFARQYGVDLQPSKPAGLRVLIVDDDPELGEMLTEFVTALDPDNEAALAHNGFEAGSLIHEFKPDLVLLDIMMPGLDGFAVCRRIKQNPQTRHIPVIAMTGKPSQQNIKAMFEAGADDCLAKPLDPEVLRNLFKRPATRPASTS